MLSVDAAILKPLVDGCNLLFSNLPAAFANARTFLALEQKIRALVIDFARCALECFLRAWLATVKPMSLARRCPRLATMRCKGRRAATLASSFGPIHVETSYFVVDHTHKPGIKRAKRAAACGRGFPALDALGITDHATPCLREMVAREILMHGSVKDAQRSLLAQGLALDSKRLWALTYGVGSELVAYQDRLASGKIPFPFCAQGKRIVLSLDGGRVRTRVPTTMGRRRKNGHRGFATPWREPKCFLLYELDVHGKRDPKGLQISEGSLDNVSETFALLERYLKAMQIHKASQILVVNDGADWIWNGLDDLLDRDILPQNKTLQLIDFYHATEYVTKICQLLGASSKQRGEYFTQVKVGGIVACLKSFKTRAVKLKGPKRIAFRKALAYLEKRVARLDYGAAQKKISRWAAGRFENFPSANAPCKQRYMRQKSHAPPSPALPSPLLYVEPRPEGSRRSKRTLGAYPDL